MADTQSNIQVSIDTTQALASIKNLQRQISAFHSSMAKGGAAANAVSAQLQQTLINSVNATGQFSAGIRTIRTTTESFTSSLERNKFSLGEYFRYAGGATKTFGRLFKTEHDTINKVARENVKDLQTQYIRLGRDASGAMKAIAVRPLSLDMTDLGTRTQVAAQKQAILNQLLKQGSTNLLNFGKNTQWAGRQLMVGFTLPLMALGSVASKTFMDMETQAIRFKKVYGDLFTPNEESQQALKDIQELGKEFTKYGIAVSSTVGLAAEAAAAGFKGLDLTRQTTAATRLSILGQVESQKALETTIALQNAFSMSSENLAESIDFLNAVENQTVLSLDDISTAIPKAAPIVQQLGGDVKDLAFLMTAMKEGGINASEGANALKSGLASLINPTGKANEMLLGFGINAKKIVVDNKGDLKKTVVEFATALNQLDPLNRAQAIEQMFGKFQFSRLSTLFANVTKEGTQAARVLDLAGASVQDLASLSEKELGMTSESAMNKFKGSIENLKLSLIPLGEEFLKAVTPIAEFVTRILEKFDGLSSGTKKFIVAVTGVIAGLGPVLLMTVGLVMNGLANMIKLFAFLKSAFNKTGQSTSILGTEVKYMTTEQRNAAAVAASLDQVHTKLAQTFTSEAAAVNALTRAYQRAIAAQSQFVPVAPPITRGPIKKFADGRPITVGGTGNKDSELALLMPGETVIPTAMSQKYGGLINAMIADNVPGYKRGVPKTGTSVKVPGGFAAAHFGGSSYKTGRELLEIVEGLDTAFAIKIRQMVSEVEGGLDRIFTVFTNEVIATSVELNEEVGQTGSGKTTSMTKAKRDLIGSGAATRDIELQRQLEAAGVPIEDIRKINKKVTERLKAGFKKLGRKATVTAEELDKLVDDAYAEVAKTDTRVRSARAKMRKITAVTDPRTDSRIAVASDPYFKFRKSGAYYAGMKRAAGDDNVPYNPQAGFKITNPMAAQIGLSSRDAAAVFKQFSDEVKVRLAGLKGDITKFSVEFAKEAEKAGLKTGNAYKVGLDKVVIADPYIRGRDRSSPHRLAAKDGRDDAVAYSTARDTALTQAGRKSSGRRRRAATRAQGPAPIGATPQPGMTILPIVSQPTKEDLRRTRNRDRFRSAKARMSGSLGGGRGMAISSGLMIGSQFLPGKAGEVAGRASGVAFGLQTLAMLPGPLKLAAVGLGAVALTAKGLSIVQERQRRAVSAMADVATVTTKKLSALGDFFGVTARKLPYEVARDGSGTLSPLGATQRSQVDLLRADQAFQDNFKNDISALKDATKQDATLVLNSLAIQLKGRGYASEQIKTIIQALQEEAGRTDLNLEFKNIGVSTEQVIERQARVIARKVTELNKLGDLIVGTGDNLFREMTKGDRWSARIVSDEVEAELETAAAAVFGTVQGMIGQFQSGELSAKDLASQINILSNEINKIPKAGQVALMDRIFKQLSPQARAAALNIKGVNTQMKVLLALSTGIISAEDKLLKVLSKATDPKVLGRAQNQLSKKMRNFFKIFEENTIEDSVDDIEDYQDSTDQLSTASEAYLKILGKQIDGLEAKRDAQKDANDETQRQIDLEMKLNDLAKQSVLAKISGDYIGAASLQQQAQNVQFEFDQETELRKKDAEIARLKAREQAIRDGAPLTKAESAKVPKTVKPKKKAASGGMIRGAGTATSDSIPALLSNGEYVVKAKSVKKYGVGTLDALNAGRFAEGGQVGRSASSYIPRLKDGGSVKDGFMQRWSKSISGSPLAEMMGTAQLLRLISGQGKKGDKLGASMVPLSLLGSGFGSKIMGNLGKSAFYLPNKINQMMNQRKVNSMLKSGVFHGSQPVGFRGEEYLQGTNILDGSMSTDPYYGMGFFGTTSKAEARLYASGYNSTNNWGESFGSMNQIIGAPRGKYVDFTRGPKSLKWQDYGLAKSLGKSMPENLGDLMNAQGLTGGIMNRVSSGRTPEDIMYAKWLAFSNPAGVMTKEIGYKNGGLVPGYARGGLVRALSGLFGGISKGISKIVPEGLLTKLSKIIPRRGPNQGSSGLPTPTITRAPKPVGPSASAMARLTPEEKAFAMADIDASAISAMKLGDVSTLSVPDEGVSFVSARAKAGLDAIKSGNPERISTSTDVIWELIQSQREALLRAKYPKANLTDVKTFNELYAKEFYGIGKDDIIKLFKGAYGESQGASWRTGKDATPTYFSTNPYVAAEYARIKDRVLPGNELPMFSMDVPISQLTKPLGQGASIAGAQGSLEFPQVMTGPMLAAQTPQPYDLPSQVYSLMTNPTKLRHARYWPYDDGLFGGAPGYHKGGPVGHRHGRNAPSTNRLNIPLSAGSTATMYSSATGLMGNSGFAAERAENMPFESIDNAMTFLPKLLWKAINPSEAPSVDKQTEKSKNLRAAAAKAINLIEEKNPAYQHWLVKPIFDALTNIAAGDGKWNDYTSIASNFVGTGLFTATGKAAIGGIKAAVGGAKAAAIAKTAKITAPVKKLTNLPATRRAEDLIKQQQLADELDRLKLFPPPRPPARPGSGAPGAPPAAAPKSMFDPDFDFESLAVSGATPEAAIMSKPSIFSKISDSSIVKKVKTLSRVASTPAYHLKAMAASAKRAWQHGPSGLRWRGNFDRMGRYQLADEAVSRLFGGIALKANPILKIAQKTKNTPNVLPEGATIFDPLNFFEKLLLDTKRPGDFYKATYKNIIPNVRKNYLAPAAEGLRGATVSALYKMAGITQTSASKLASRAVPIKDISTAVMKSFSYKMKSAVKDKYRSFLNIFKTTKVGKPFDNSPIDYRSLLMTGAKADSLHSPEIAEAIVGGSQYYIKMLSKIAQAKEIFGSEWMHRIDLPAPVNRPVSNTPDSLIGKNLDDIKAIASEDYNPLGYATVKDFLAGKTGATIFNPTDLGQVVKAGAVKERLAADVAQSVLGHGDLHPGNQLIDIATGKLGMLDFESILARVSDEGLSETAEIFKIRGVEPEFIANSLRDSLRKITDIPPSEILDMMRRAKVPKPEELLATYMERLQMTKEEIDNIISSKLFLADGGYINKEKVRVPKFAKGGLIRGPGTGISDSVRATLGYAGGGSIRVSNGEYVVKASSVRDYGVKTMDAINNGTATVGANSGGTVYNINMPVTSNNANAEIVANEVVRKLKLEVSKNNKSNKVGK